MIVVDGSPGLNGSTSYLGDEHCGGEDLDWLTNQPLRWLRVFEGDHEALHIVSLESQEHNSIYHTELGEETSHDQLPLPDVRQVPGLEEDHVWHWVVCEVWPGREGVELTIIDSDNSAGCSLSCSGVVEH